MDWDWDEDSSAWKQRLLFPFLIYWSKNLSHFRPLHSTTKNIVEIAQNKDLIKEQSNQEHQVSSKAQNQDLKEMEGMVVTVCAQM